jgi:hypothetical protein
MEWKVSMKLCPVSILEQRPATDICRCRQIRNAFQTAIALIEHETQQADSGQPKPALGKAQFQIVAKGSKDFERYLFSALGAADSDIAIREGVRADRFANVELASASTSAPATMPSRKPTRVSLQSANDQESTDTDPSSDSDEDTSDDGDGDGNNERRSSMLLGKSAVLPPVTSKRAERNAIQRSDPMYEEFLRWKHSRK